MDDEEDNFQNIIRLGLVSFFTDVSSEMVFSILPVFILGLPGGSAATLGFIEGVAESLSCILRAVSGIVSDKFRRRKIFILIGYGISNIAKPFFSMASTITDTLIIRVLDRVGKGVRTAPRDALISDSVSSNRRGEAFGLHRMLDQTGAIIGPLLATGVMILLGWSMNDIFLLSLVPGSIALLIILFGIKEIIGGEGKLKLMEGLHEVIRGRFLFILGLVFLFSLGAFNFSFILLNAKEMGVGDTLIPIVYAVVNLTHTIIAIPAGRIADRIGKEKVLTMGYGVFFITTIMLPTLPKIVYSAYFIAAVYGVYVGVTETVQRALIPSYVDNNLRGTAYGVYYFVVGVAFLIANTVVGKLWETRGLWVSSFYSGILSAIAIIGLFIFNRNH